MPPSEFFRQRRAELARGRSRRRPAVIAPGRQDLALEEGERSGFLARLLRLMAWLVVAGYLFRVALVLKYGPAGYAALFSPLRELGPWGALVSEVLMPDRLALVAIDLIRPLM